MFTKLLNEKCSNKTIHFVGIGGIGMSSIAELMCSLGWNVTGSDLARDTKNIIRLKYLGAEIYNGHHENNISDQNIVVYSSAIVEDNPEILKSQELKIPIYKRAKILAELMKKKTGIAVAGTHGKTTTTSLLATIMHESQVDPSYSIGGIVKNLEGHAKIGDGEHFIAEVDESDGSFLEFTPNFATITNIDNDHMSHYGTEDNLFDAFMDFVNKMPKNGVVTINHHDEKLKKIAEQTKLKVYTLGLDKDADYYAENIKYTSTTSEFDLYYLGKKETRIIINLPGKHNVLNSLSAISMAHISGISFCLISKSLLKFESVGRRLEVIYASDSFKIIDDYAHHPTEIIATLRTLKEVSPEKEIISVFQPHRFTRTKECWGEYVKSFDFADKVYLTPIYAASEVELDGVNSKELAVAINKYKKNSDAYALDKLSDLSRLLESYEKSENIIVTMGAGNISTVVRKWVSSK